MLVILGLRLSEKVGEVWKVRQRMRGHIVGIEGPDRIHLAGREALITVRKTVLHASFNGPVFLCTSLLKLTQ